MYLVKTSSILRLRLLRKTVTFHKITNTSQILRTYHSSSRAIATSACSFNIQPPHHLSPSSLPHVHPPPLTHRQTEHGKSWRAAEVVADPEPAPEQLHGQVLAATAVQHDAVLLPTPQHHRHVTVRRRLGRVQLDVTVCVPERQAGQVLAVFTCGTWSA